ncbi:MAG: hypothetical protein ABIA21_00245 [Candidatus Aenigmatarchaeota archaeon]
MHIKVIKGKRYYYESKRIGKRVTSKYIGPVEKKTKRKDGNQDVQESSHEEASGEDESYIG